MSRNLTVAKLVVTSSAIALLVGGADAAGMTDLANAPLITITSNNGVKPNLMFMLDDSGSMGFTFTPDFVGNDYNGASNQKSNCFNSSSGVLVCTYGHPPFMSSDFNKQYYNPDIYYRPPSQSNGTAPMLDQDPSNAATDPFSTAQRKDFRGNSISAVNLKAQTWPDLSWLNNGGNRQNGMSPPGSPTDSAVRVFPVTDYQYPKSGYSSDSVVYVYPYYYRINPFEYCSDKELKTCRYASSPSGAYTYPARVRWCTDSSQTNCQAKFIDAGSLSYTYPHFVGKYDSSRTYGVIPVSGIALTYPVSNIKVFVNNRVIHSGLLSANSATDLTSQIVNAINAKGLYKASNSTNPAVLNTTSTSDASFSGTYCGDSATNICIRSSSSVGTNDNRADVQICQSSGSSCGTVKFAAPMSQRFYVGSFERVDIDPARTTYPKTPGRIDCVTVSNVCNYDEEIKNFANWFSYYRTRMHSMKSGVGLAFQLLDDKYRVGYSNIHAGSIILPVQTFDTTYKSTWYSTFYAANPSGGTPLRSALKSMGRYYEGLLSGVADPIQKRADGTSYECQPNYTLLTTDGFWNTDSDSSINVGNQDSDENDASGYVKRTLGTFDGGAATSASNTLADIAMYYYKRDLRPSIPDRIVPTATDPAEHQHMTTFTLGLGVDGYVSYDPKYDLADEDASGDYAKIKRGNSGCVWTNGVCNWPMPEANKLSAVDDLWHAAVNGHGRYYSASDPETLRNGIADALNRIKAAEGTGAASATSTPNITQIDRIILSGSYALDAAHDDWNGEVEMSVINTSTLDADPNYVWKAQAKLDGMSPASRHIKTFNGNGMAPKDFTWDAFSSSERAFFNNQGSRLTQYALLSPANKAILDNGENIVNFVRGDQTYATGAGAIMRKRQHLLGPIINARPAYVHAPNKSYTDPGYSTYKDQKAGRAAMAYVAANDGMLHAFSADMIFATSQVSGSLVGTPQPTGNELTEVWAYVPKMVMPTLPLLAEQRYGSNQKFTVDGSPVTADAYFNGIWHTVLIGGLNKGGSGYYALDVTDPANPVVLWEFCSSSLCSQTDGDLGYSYGNPIVTKNGAGRWVVYVTSGLNNASGGASSGDGKGYLYQLDLATGAVLNKVGTGIGSSSDPSGLMKITAWVEAPTRDNTATQIYGGDQQGNLWRFDVSNDSVPIPAPVRLAGLQNPSGDIEPITVEPTLGYCGGQKMVFLGTGRLLGANDLTDTRVQTIYGIKDTATNLGDNVRTNQMARQTMSVGSGGVQTRTFSNLPFNPATQNGWYMDLTAQQGEKVTVNPRWLLGHLYVYGNYPITTDACRPDGTAVLYDIQACSGTVASTTAFSSTIAGGTPYCYGTECVFQNMQTNKRHTVTRAANDAQGSRGVRVSWREVLE